MAFWRNYAHLVWATKNRQPFITDVIEAQLFAQMVHSVSEIGCYVYAINGTEDHVHVVLTCPPKHSIASVTKLLKGASAHFVNHILRPPAYHFEWQRGYGCLSLGQSQIATAVAYVQQQKEHHATQTTNRWLERCSELEEGPALDDKGLPASRSLREDAVEYDSWGQFPF